MALISTSRMLLSSSRGERVVAFEGDVALEVVVFAVAAEVLEVLSW